MRGVLITYPPAQGVEIFYLFIPDIPCMSNEIGSSDRPKTAQSRGSLRTPCLGEIKFRISILGVYTGAQNIFQRGTPSISREASEDLLQ